MKLVGIAYCYDGHSPQPLQSIPSSAVMFCNDEIEPLLVLASRHHWLKRVIIKTNIAPAGIQS